jgi:hypothetical protein
VPTILKTTDAAKFCGCYAQDLFRAEERGLLVSIRETERLRYWPLDQLMEFRIWRAQRAELRRLASSDAPPPQLCEVVG